jgi:hypothetical protein
VFSLPRSPKRVFQDATIPFHYFTRIVPFSPLFNGSGDQIQYKIHRQLRLLRTRNPTTTPYSTLPEQVHGSYMYVASTVWHPAILAHRHTRPHLRAPSILINTRLYNQPQSSPWSLRLPHARGWTPFLPVGLSYAVLHRSASLQNSLKTFHALHNITAESEHSSQRTHTRAGGRSNPPFTPPSQMKLPYTQDSSVHTPIGMSH